jgi:hypothetical protein
MKCGFVQQGRVVIPDGFIERWRKWSSENGAILVITDGNAGEIGIHTSAFPPK